VTPCEREDVGELEWEACWLGGVEGGESREDGEGLKRVPSMSIG
jgi:hypothetical protein